MRREEPQGVYKDPVGRRWPSNVIGQELDPNQLTSSEEGPPFPRGHREDTQDGQHHVASIINFTPR